MPTQSRSKQARNFLFLGAGKMGGAILQKLNSEWQNKNLSKAITARANHVFSVIKPSAKTTGGNSNQIKFYKTASNLPKNYRADLVFLCIKPQNSAEILSEFAKNARKAKIFDEKTIFISILAGKNCDFFQQFFGENAKILRIMPNLAVVSGDGIIPYFFGDKFNAAEKKFLKEILMNLGENFEVKDEEKFHELTALFGCGPAYIFLLQEVFFKIAKDLKINEDLAEKLVKTLLLGSAKLAKNFEKSFENNLETTSKKSSKTLQNSFSSLIESVASKGGATEAALQVLNENSSLEKLFAKAIKTAAERSKLLAKK